jgi:hypothetical protein
MTIIALAGAKMVTGTRRIDLFFQFCYACTNVRAAMQAVIIGTAVVWRPPDATAHHFPGYLRNVNPVTELTVSTLQWQRSGSGQTPGTMINEWINECASDRRDIQYIRQNGPKLRHYRQIIDLVFFHCHHFLLHHPIVIPQLPTGGAHL